MKKLNVKMKVLMVHVFMIVAGIGMISCFDKSEDPTPTTEMRGPRPPHHKGGCNRDTNQEEDEVEETVNSEI